MQAFAKFGASMPSISAEEVRFPAAGVLAGAALGFCSKNFTGPSITLGLGAGLAVTSLVKEPWLFGKSDTTPIRDAAAFAIPAGLAWFAVAGLRRALS